jgi:hypothetical protein
VTPGYCPLDTSFGYAKLLSSTISSLGLQLVESAFETTGAHDGVIGDVYRLAAAKPKLYSSLGLFV